MDPEESMPTLTHQEIEAIRKDLGGDTDHLKTYRNYVSGEHSKLLSAEQLAIMGQMGAKPLADNVVRLIVRTAASRLDFEGWSVDDANVAAFLEELWFMNQIEDLQFHVHFDTLTDGNHAILLKWRPDPMRPEGGRVTLHREAWWDGAEGIFIAYDGDDPVWAVKEWKPRTSEKRRRVVYYPDRIERFIQDGEGWSRYRLPGDPGNLPGVAPWRRKGEPGRPLGLPIVHFRNGRHRGSPYGASDVLGLLALQDDLNMLQRDMSIAAAYTAFQIYFLAGGKLDQGFVPAPGVMVEIQDAAGKFGAVPAGSMSELRETHAYKRQTMAIDSETPMHLISGGDWPSGNALLRAEMPLVDKVKRLGRAAGPSWIQVAHRATEIANTFGVVSLDEAKRIRANFAPAERLDEMALMEAATAKANLYILLDQITDDLLIEKLDILSAEELKTYLANRKRRQAEAQAAAEAIAAGEAEGLEPDRGAAPGEGDPRTIGQF